MQLAHIDFLDEQIDALSVEIMRSLTELEPGGASTPPTTSAAAVGEAGGAEAPRGPAPRCPLHRL